MTAEITGIVLAGGRSTRFGADKASALLAGRPLLHWVMAALEPACGQIIVVRARSQALPGHACAIPVVIAEDEYEQRGPLAGLITGLGVAGPGLSFATSCDTPLLRPGLIPLLAGAAVGTPCDAVAPVVAGVLQPLAAIYHAESCLPIFRATLEAGRASLRAALASIRTIELAEAAVRVADPELDSFRGANTPADLEAIAALIARREGPPT